MSNKIPTAEEFLKQLDEKQGTIWTEDDDSICKALIEFAQIHVKAALEAAAENIPSEISIDEKTFDKMGVRYLSEESEKGIKKAIIKAYPSENIK